MEGQLSLLEQARLDAPQLSDEQRVALLAERLVAELDTKPPIDLKMVASWQGVARVEVADIPWAGCLVTDCGEVVMKLRRSDARRRQRFTGFHEVGHTFCPGYLLQPQFRCNPSATVKRADLEGLCDIVASELLYPARLVRADLRDAHFGLDTVAALADRYDGSFESAAHRFVNLWPEDTLLVVLEPGLRKEESNDAQAEPKLRVSSVHANGAWTFIPRNKSASDSSPLTRALRGELVDETTILDDICPAVEGVELSARLVPYARDGNQIERVLALYRRPSKR